MAELSFPSIGGGSVLDANYEKLIGTSVPSGLIGTADTSDLVYGDSSGRQIKVKSNRAAMVRGYRWETDGAGIVRSIAANTSGQPRIDLAVLRLNRADWTVTFQVIQGTPASTPVAPSPTMSEGPSGVWELPVAQVAVANQASTITAANVTTRGVYINSYSLDGVRSAPPPAGIGGRMFYAGDVARVYHSFGGSWQITGERSAVVNGTASSGWNPLVLKYQRVNGFVHMVAQMQRTGGNLAADTESTMFVIPSAYRPVNNGDFAMVGYAGGAAVRLYIDVSGGQVILQDYTIQITINTPITIHPAIWPAQNT